MASAEYQREYWKKHPERYEIHKENMRVYGKTKKARIQNRISTKKWFKKNPDYSIIKNYEKRKKAIKEGMCYHCYIRKATDGYSCKKCWESGIKSSKKFKEKK